MLAFRHYPPHYLQSKRQRNISISAWNENLSLLAHSIQLNLLLRIRWCRANNPMEFCRSLQLYGTLLCLWCHRSFYKIQRLFSWHFLHSPIYVTQSLGMPTNLNVIIMKVSISIYKFIECVPLIDFKINSLGKLELNPTQKDKLLIVSSFSLRLDLWMWIKIGNFRRFIGFPRILWFFLWIEFATRNSKRYF